MKRSYLYKMYTHQSRTRFLVLPVGNFPPAAWDEIAVGILFHPTLRQIDSLTFFVDPIKKMKKCKIQNRIKQTTRKTKKKTKKKIEFKSSKTQNKPNTAMFIVEAAFIFSI